MATVTMKSLWNLWVCRLEPLTKYDLFGGIYSATSLESIFYFRKWEVYCTNDTKSHTLKYSYTYYHHRYYQIYPACDHTLLNSSNWRNLRLNSLSKALEIGKFMHDWCTCINLKCCDLSQWYSTYRQIKNELAKFGFLTLRIFLMQSVHLNHSGLESSTIPLCPCDCWFVCCSNDSQDEGAKVKAGDTIAWIGEG